MGMYTEIYVNVDLKLDTPDDVISTLHAICCDGCKKFTDKPVKWRNLFDNNSFYLPQTSCANLTYNNRVWSLLGKGDIKNYEREIEQFFEWLMPWIEGDDGDFVGYIRHEDNQTPTLVLLNSP